MGLNKPVDFPTAKLLKEKGFDNECWNYYTLAYGKKPYITQGIEYQSDAKIKFDWNCNNENSKRIQAPYPNTFHSSQCSAPTIVEVVCWIYSKYDIWISVSHKRHSEGKHWWYSIKQANGIETYLWEHNSLTEAYEAAIEYTLKNLIK